VLTVGGLARYFVFFAIDLKTRAVTIAGISKQPDGPWMAQMARKMTDAVEGFLKDSTKLIVDRDPLYTAQSAAMLGAEGVELLRLPARSPNLSAYAERFVLSIKSECLRNVIPLGEAHLRTLVREYVEHYHGERNHQGLENLIPFPIAAPMPANGTSRGESGSGGF
jgi:transposase InsO family protein